MAIVSLESENKLTVYVAAMVDYLLDKTSYTVEQLILCCKHGHKLSHFGQKILEKNHFLQTSQMVNHMTST